MAKIRILEVQGGCPPADVKALALEAGIEVVDLESAAGQDGERSDDEPGEERVEGAAGPEPEVPGEAEPEPEAGETEQGAPHQPPSDGSRPEDVPGIEDVVLGEVPKASGGDETLIVVLEPACDADPSFADQMRKAAACGTKVIGIWPPHSEAGEVPQAFEDFGHDTIPWDPARLRDVVTTVAADPVWLGPTGVQRPQPKTKRNKCR